MAAERLLTRPFVLGFAANFLHSLAFHSYLHLPGYLHGKQAGPFIIGVVMATMALSAILFRPAVGRIIDSKGRRIVVLAGGALHVLAALAYLTIDGVGPWLYAVRAIHGVAEAMLFTVLFTIAADVVPISRRTEGIALFGISGMIPLALAGALGDAILARGDYTDLFIFTSGAALLGALAGLALPDSRPGPTEDTSPARPFFQAIFAPPLRPLWLVGTAFSFALASYFTFLKTFILERQVGSMGLFFTLYMTAAVVLRFVLGWVPDRIGQRRVLIPAVVCVAAGVAVLAAATTDFMVGLAGVLCGIGHGYAFPIASALVVTRARPSERGAALAAFTALFNLGLLIGGPVLGFVLARSNHGVMFATAAGVALTGVIVFAVWDRRVVSAS